MAPRVFQAFFLNVIFCLVAAQSIKYGLKGQEVKLKPLIQEQQPDLILWMHDDNKVVEFNGKEEDVYGPFKHRTTLDWHSAELHLTDLRSEDSGLYELELYTQKKSYFYYYTLKVIDKVAKPTITCETNSSKSSNLSGLLTCSAPQPDIEYEWFFYGNTQPGPQLRIFLDNKHDERVYSCCVSNPLSNETAEFTAKDCYSGESSSVVLAAVLSAVVLLLLVLVLAGVVIYRRYYKGRDNETEGEMQKGFDKNAELDTAVMEQLSLLSQYEPDPAVKEASDLESSTEQTGRDNETAEDGESQPLLTFSPIKEGESQVQDEAPKQGGVRRLRDQSQRFGAQQTPANSHRNHRDFSPQSQQKRPRQGQKGSDEDDQGDEGTELDTEVVSDERDRAEKEASDLESSTEQRGRDNETAEDGESQLPLTSSPIKGRDNETAEDGESQLPLTFSPIKEGESQVQDEAPKQGIVRRRIEEFELRGAQQTPANSHRNHRDFCPQSQQKRPRQGQKGSDEDDQGDEGTKLVTEVVSDKPDPAEKEASDLESSTEQTASENENKVQFIHSAGEDREVGSAQVIKELDKSSGEADKSVDNSSGEADKSDIQINLTSFHTGAVS